MTGFTVTVSPCFPHCVFLLFSREALAGGRRSADGCLKFEGFGPHGEHHTWTV